MVAQMLDQAFGRLKGQTPLLHSGQGVLCRTEAYRTKLAEKGMVQSMSRKGTPGQCADGAFLRYTENGGFLSGRCAVGGGADSGNIANKHILRYNSPMAYSEDFKQPVLKKLRQGWTIRRTAKESGTAILHHHALETPSGSPSPSKATENPQNQRPGTARRCRTLS
ncbi:hypothetical protein CGZ65_01815 [Neisseria weixii]|nr:hypothetical protein CGZ65_01815 [Neisseria weixii]